MGLMDQAKAMGKKAIEKGTSIGRVCSADFPKGSYANRVKMDGDEWGLAITYPNDEKYYVKHEDIESTFILGMGVVDFHTSSQGNKLVYGVKYKIIFKDGKVAVLTADLSSQYFLEEILF